MNHCQEGFTIPLADPTSTLHDGGCHQHGSNAVLVAQRISCYTRTALQITVTCSDNSCRPTVKAE